MSKGADPKTPIEITDMPLANFNVWYAREQAALFPKKLAGSSSIGLRKLRRTQKDFLATKRKQIRICHSSRFSIDPVPECIFQRARIES